MEPDKTTHFELHTHDSDGDEYVYSHPYFVTRGATEFSDPGEAAKALGLWINLHTTQIITQLGQFAKNAEIVKVVTVNEVTRTSLKGQELR